jgi:hypothetical protein
MSIPTRHIAAGVLLAASLLAPPGSHTARAETAGAVVPMPDADHAQLEKLLGKGVVGVAVASAPLASPETYLPQSGATRSYQVLEGKKVSTETHKVEATTDEQFAPGWHYSAGSIGAVFLQKTGEGDLVVVAEQDLEHKVLSRFTPGEPLIVPGLKPGESRQFQLKVEVAELSDPTDIEHSGSLDVTYTYVGTYSVTVPAGTYEAALIKWDYEGKVGPASIKDSYYRFIAPSAGMVAMIENKRISAMLIYNEKTKLGKVLEKAN